MKTPIFFSAILIASSLLISGCEKSQMPDKPQDTVSEDILRTFSEMFPQASNVQWELRGDYAKASFDLPDETKSPAKGKNSAWFSNRDGEWNMTEKDIRYEELPDAVKTAFEASEYSSWRIDDVDMIIRHGVEEIYVIEVEQGNNETDLYYSADGILTKKIEDAENGYDYEDYIPGEYTSSIREYIDNEYPGARITDIDDDENGIEIEIIHEREVVELLFTYDNKLIYTKTEARLSEIPQSVLDAVYKEYPECRIDEADFYVLPDGEEYYIFEIEMRGKDYFEIKASLDGTISIPDNGNHAGSGIPEKAAEFIETNYPGARITDTDMENGYIVVEILHDGTEKEVIFSQSMEWIGTIWEIGYRQLPENVKDSLKTNYPKSEYDDISFFEGPDGDCYIIEMEIRDRDITIRMDQNGNILD